MQLPELLKDFARYNLWANEKMVNWLRAAPDALLQQETPSSFPSLRLTMLHIWDAQQIWLLRLQGEPAMVFPSTYFSGSAEEMMDGLLANSRAFSDFVQRAADAFFQAEIRYRNTKGDLFTTPNAEVLLHCLQHSTYHRGQLVTMARKLGLTDPPQTDYIAYVRVRDQN